MKKITALFLLVATFMVYGQGMKFEETSFSSLMKKAKAENKLVFVDAYASWCGPCKLMAKNIFTKPAVGDYYNANFINTKIDMEKGEGVALAKKYGVKAFPTYLFINSDGEVMYRGTGYYEENDFIKIGKEANDPNKQISVLMKRFDAGEKDPGFLMNFMKVFAFSDTDLARKAAERYFAGKTGQALSQEELGYLFQLVGDSTTPLYQELISRKDELLKMMPEARYNAMLVGYKFQTVMKAAYNKDTKVLNDAVFIAEAKKVMPESEVMPQLNKTKMKLAFSNKDYAAYQKLATAYYGDGSAANFTSEELNSVAWNYFEKVIDKNALLNAVKWAEQSVKKNESYANTDTLANLYLKVGDKKNAKLWAEKSIELAKKEGEDYSSTKKVLDTALKK